MNSFDKLEKHLADDKMSKETMALLDRVGYDIDELEQDKLELEEAFQELRNGGRKEGAWL